MHEDDLKEADSRKKRRLGCLWVLMFLLLGVGIVGYIYRGPINTGIKFIQYGYTQIKMSNEMSGYVSNLDELMVKVNDYKGKDSLSDAQLDELEGLVGAIIDEDDTLRLTIEGMVLQTKDLYGIGTLDDESSNNYSRQAYDSGVQYLDETYDDIVGAINLIPDSRLDSRDRLMDSYSNSRERTRLVIHSIFDDEVLRRDFNLTDQEIQEIRSLTITDDNI